jgi:hypothetical protein
MFLLLWVLLVGVVVFCYLMYLAVLVMAFTIRCIVWFIIFIVSACLR